jgi:ABC-type transport system involved in multi-copper enzyme maturation permease subunit
VYLHFLTALKLGLRSRSFLALALIGVLAMGGAILASQFSGRQPAAVAMDVGISAVRVIAVLVALFWAQELLGRDRERGVLATVLSYPVSRVGYLFGRFLGVSFLLALTLTGFAGLLAALGWVAGLGYEQSSPVRADLALIPFILFLWLELVVITAFTWLMTALTTTPFLPFLLGMAFTWVGRSLAVVLGYLAVARGGTMTEMQDHLGVVLEALLWLLPDLSRLDLRTGVLYGQWPDFMTLVLTAANALGYAAILMGLAIWRFNHREQA